MISVDNLVQAVNDFPTLPTIYAKLTEVMDNPRSTAADLAKVISTDQSAAAKVLRTANSSLYGLRGKVSTVTQAIVYIGFEEIKNLVIAISIINLFSKTKKGGAFNPIDLWKHSIAVGVITRNLGGKIGVRKLENYFVSGILHDIGKLLFFKTKKQDYMKVINYALENNLTARAAEQRLFGITHTVAGELLAEKWKLPLSIRNAIKYHYIGIVDGKVDPMVACVHIADIVAVLLELGQAGDDVVPEPNREIFDSLDLPENIFTTMLPKILTDYEESISMILTN